MLSLAQNYLTRGFWGDEAWTSLISQLPYVQMLKTTASDFHPPGYYTIVEFVYKFLPPTEIVTRSVSIIFYLLTIFMVYKLVSYSSVILSNSEGSQDSSSSPQNDKKKILGLSTLGLLSAMVVAVNPIFFTYAFEARNYTMFAFAATGSIFFLVRLFSQSFIVNDPQNNLDSSQRLPRHRWPLAMTKDEVLFVFFSALGIYTHYYMFFVLAAQGLYLVLFDRKILLKMIGLYAIAAILYLPWLPFLLGQLKSVGQSYWIGAIDVRTHYEALLRILGGENQNVIRPWLFGLSVLLLVVGLGQHTIRRKFEKPPLRSAMQNFEGQAYLLIWLWAIVPFVLATLPGLKVDGIHFPFRPIFFWRYLIGSSVPLSMVMVHAAQKFPKYLMWGAVALLIALSLAVDYLTLVSYPYGFKQVYANDVLPKIKQTDKLVTVLPSFAEVLYYRNRNHLANDLIVLPEGLVQFSGKSLLDAYVANGVVEIANAPPERYFELTPGPSLGVRD